MKLTFPRVGIAILLLFAILIRHDLFPSHEEEAAEEGHAVAHTEGGEAAPVHAGVAAEVAVVETTPAPVTEPAPEKPAPVEATAPATPVASAEPETAVSVAPAAEVIANPVAAPSVPSEPVAPAPASVTSARSVGHTQDWSVTDYWVAARTAYLLGDVGRAGEEYSQLLAAEPGNWYAHEELGNVFARNGQIELAVNQYQRAALLLVHAGHFEDAQRLALRMAQLYPQWKDRLPEGLADH